MAGELRWIIGNVDNRGAVRAHEKRDGGKPEDTYHRKEESGGWRFRWNARNKSFLSIGVREPTDEQWEAVLNYLVKRGYATDDDFNWKR